MITALGLEHFARSKVDLAVIETGLGGRLDASNVLLPLLTMTTDISLDHTEILGDTIKVIAGEKAGIIKPKVPHLISQLPRSAETVMRRTCQKQGAPFYELLPEDYRPGANGNRFDFHANGLDLPGVKLSLRGPHQIKNAALVLKGAAILKKVHHLRLPKKAMRNGLDITSWPGRFQILEKSGKPRLVLDVCHNEGSVQAFVETFQTRFPGRKAHLIVGFVKRKPHRKMFDRLKAIADRFYLVPLATKRSTDLKELIETVDFSPIPMKKFGRLESAYQRLLKECRPDDIIGVIGSHFLVGEFLSRHGK